MKPKSRFFVTIIVLLLVAGVIMYGSSPSKATVSDNKVKITGMYGIDLPISDILAIQLSDTIPEIITKTDGFSSGDVLKGNFELKQYGVSHLLINSNNPPYLIITTEKPEKIIVNLDNKADTEKLFNEIEELRKK
ncbi:hypothetical protein [Tenacibaculum amylolyticum]|uniref:hypothetical protein n=1 Tax=Tenacibaculum amylolyticum TaxID=104269 RepID=UPI003893F760